MKIRFVALLGVALLGLAVFVTPTAAEEHPVQLSLFTPIQIFPEEDVISAFRFNLLYGRSASVTGLDIGLINHTTTGVSKGIQWGMVGLVDSDFVGLQHNVLVNVTEGTFEGLQLGLVNHTNNARGIQLGLVNYTETMHGLQIGLVNIIRQDGVLPVLPIINWSF
jgi:hypothetical protein